MLLDLGYGLRSKTSLLNGNALSLAGIPSIVYDLDVTQSASYAGIGQYWYNLIESPADGGNQSDYTHWAGVNPTVTSGDEMAYSGPPGSTAYFEVNNTNDAWFVQGLTSSQPDFIKTFHQSNEGQKRSIVMCFRSPSTWTGDASNNETMFFGDENNNAKDGFKAGYHVGDEEVFFVIGTGVHPTPSAGYRFEFPESVLDTDTDYMLVFTLSHTGGDTTITLSINGLYKRVVTQAVSNTASASGAFCISNDDSQTHTSTGTRWYHFSMYNDALTPAQMATIHSVLSARHGRSYMDLTNNITSDGLRIEIDHGNWIGLGEVDIYNENGTESFSSLLPNVASHNSGKGHTDFTNISAGEYAVDSNYSSAVANMDDGNVTTVMWSENSTAGLIVFGHFNANVSPVTKIRLRFNNTGSYGVPSTFVMTNKDGTTLTPVETIISGGDVSLILV